MLTSRFLTKVATVITILLVTLSSVGPAYAAAPTNDNFDSATVIDPGALPFSDAVNNSEATTEPNEQLYFCEYSPKTVWYSFTPSASGVFKADMAGSSFGDTRLNLYQAVSPGIEGLSVLQCASYGRSLSFTAQAGTTYYFQAGSIYSGGGDLHLNLQEIPPPPNDDFANATVIPSLPFDDTVVTAAATVEAGEPMATCAFTETPYTVWYAFTSPITGSVSASFLSPSYAHVTAAYTGDSLTSLTQVDCGVYGNFLTIDVVAGTTYYFQVTATSLQSYSIQFHLDGPPPPQAGFYIYPPDPSVFDLIPFSDSSSDPANVGFESFAWDFGDGTGSIFKYLAWHQYASDGDYTVQLTVTTYDGRSASTSQIVPVRTHDVAITKISAPQSASSGQTRPITVYINNTRYPETVRVDLYKSNPNYIGDFDFLGTSTQPVPVRSANHATSFTFNYTFTSSDASVGKVRFKAIATIVNARDAFSGDNELLSSPPTKVAK
jgi:PKD domain